jgi:hypothetical protein
MIIISGKSTDTDEEAASLPSGKQILLKKSFGSANQCWKPRSRILVQEKMGTHSTLRSWKIHSKKIMVRATWKPSGYDAAHHYILKFQHPSQRRREARRLNCPILMKKFPPPGPSNSA